MVRKHKIIRIEKIDVLPHGQVCTKIPCRAPLSVCFVKVFNPGVSEFFNHVTCIILAPIINNEDFIIMELLLQD